MSGRDKKAPPVSPARRKVMAWGLWGILGIIGAASVWPVAELLARHKVRARSLKFFDAAPLDSLPESGVAKVEIIIRGGERPDTRAFIRRDPDGTLTAFSAICTHLGCLINFNRVRGEFVCPCHGGRYDINGNVIDGPPPVPLARLPVRVAGGVVQVGFRV